MPSRAPAQSSEGRTEGLCPLGRQRLTQPESASLRTPAQDTRPARPTGLGRGRAPRRMRAEESTHLHASPVLL